MDRKVGELLLFHLENSPDLDELEVFTTRPDPIFGLSFCAISPNHPLAKTLSQTSNKIQFFIEECNALSTDQASLEKQDKVGIDTGIRVTHPFTKESIPLFIANFVLMDYGSGAIFGCPAHDQET